MAVFQLDKRKAGQHPGDERNAEIDEYALRYLSDRNIYHDALEPEPDRKHGYEDVSIDGKEKDLKDRVKCHKTGSILGISAGKVVPDDHHGNAPGKADHDQTDHVFGIRTQEDDGKNEHENGADDPVLHERQAEHLPVPEDLAQLLVLHLCQRRVHHQDQADGDRDIGRPDLKAVDEGFRALDEIPESHAKGHCREDPERKKPVYER